MVNRWGQSKICFCLYISGNRLPRFCPKQSRFFSKNPRLVVDYRKKFRKFENYRLWSPDLYSLHKMCHVFWILCFSMILPHVITVWLSLLIWLKWDIYDIIQGATHLKANKCRIHICIYSLHDMWSSH